MPPRILAAALALALCAPACSGDRRTPPILFIGVDGLEWDVLLPMLEAGELPALEGLVRRGTSGKLRTFEPTLSPVVWTSIATGKAPSRHGIEHFIRQDPETGSVRLNSNGDRKAKALWNILSDYDRTVHVVGWWMTFPAEKIRGTMVAQTNTASQVDVSFGRASWKGTVIPGLEGQVHPVDFQPRVMEIVDETARNLDATVQEAFGTFEHPLAELDRRLWENTLWAFRADRIYLAAALEILRRREPYDLLLVYFGGPDVVGHRFWRYREPGAFAHPPSPEQVENFGGVIPDCYRYVDRAIAELLEAAGPGADVLVVSDHGMHAVNRDKTFDPDDPPEDVNSGHHMDAPPGVFIAAGPSFRTRAGGLPDVGTVLDVAPTILRLLDLPVGRDFDGRAIVDVIAEEVLGERPAQFVDSHDSEEWLRNRPGQLLTPAAESERMEQLRSLGYIK